MARGPRRGALAHLAVPGAEIAVRVVPGAGRNSVEQTEAGLVIRTTQIAEGGRATAAVQAALAAALGVAKTRLTLVRGALSREKLFRLD